jgi:hypothetical protein
VISSLFHSVILVHRQAPLDTLALSAIEPIGSHSRTESIRRQGLFPNDWNKKITVIFTAMCVVASSRRSARSLHDLREFTLVSILFGSGTIMRAFELTRASFTSSHQGWTSTVSLEDPRGTPSLFDSALWPTTADQVSSASIRPHGLTNRRSVVDFPTF